MKRSAVFLFIFLCVAATASAQRTIPPVSKITDYRPVGQTRMWAFVQRDSAVGRLTSTIKGTDDVGDSTAVVVAQTLNLDYTRIGQTLQFTSSGERYVSEQGTYLGDDLTLTVNGALAQLKLERDGKEVTGFFTRDGQKETVTKPIGVNQQALDVNYYDQIEMYLALHGLRVGDSVTDTLFSPEIQLPVTLSYFVQAFQYEKLTTQVAESVFVVKLIEPELAILYFTPDRRLMKVSNSDIHRKVYLDRIVGGATAKKEGSSEQKPLLPQIPFSVLALATLPHAITYAIFALIAFAFFAFGHLRKGAVWFALVWGMIAFIPVNYLQTPVQNWIVETIFIPNLKKGGALFFWAIFPALSIGIIQEAIKFGTLNLFLSVRKIKAYLAPSIGSAVGAGFGLVEGIMNTAALGILPLIGMSLIERASLILFHAAAGALLGMGIVRGEKQMFTALAITVAVNSLLRYLPVFVQAKIADVTLLYIIFGLVGVGFLGFVLLQLRQSPKESVTRPKQ